MANKKIHCSVCECIHNKREICDVDALNVAGSHADQTDETYCASFDAGNNYQSCMNATPVDVCDYIECDVVNCVYNENKECSLDEIKVDYERGCDHCNTSLNTCCDSFEAE